MKIEDIIWSKPGTETNAARSHSWVDTSNPDFIKEGVVVIPAGADSLERRVWKKINTDSRTVLEMGLWAYLRVAGYPEWVHQGRKACPLWAVLFPAPFPGLPTLGGAIPCTTQLEKGSRAEQSSLLSASYLWMWNNQLLQAPAASTSPCWWTVT